MFKPDLLKNTIKYSQVESVTITVKISSVYSQKVENFWTRRTIQPAFHIRGLSQNTKHK